MARREYKGAAVQTRLTANIGAGDTSFGINSAAGWPTGGANGSFYVTLDPGTSTEERILVGSRSATTLSSVTRGVDDTTGVAHSAGADGTVIHSFSADDADEANAHINDTALDHHTQYMKADGTRHDLTARHLGGSIVPTATPVATGTALAEGAGTNLAKSTHVHTIGTGSINAANMFAAGVVDAAALAANSVDTSELVDNAVTNSKMADNSVNSAEIVANAVTNAKVLDATLTFAKFASDAPTAWTPVWTSSGGATTLGNGVLTGTMFKLGRMIVFSVFFKIGSTTSFPAGHWEFTLPGTADWGHGASINLGFAIPSLTIFNNSGTREIGINIVSTGSTDRFMILERVGLALVGATVPFSWGTDDFFQMGGVIFTTT